MALKCADLDALSKAIINRYNVPADDTQMGKRIFRIDGFICTLFTNGTVQFQGKTNLEIQMSIENAIQKLNSLHV
jgi:hypothetical protein